MKTLSKWVVLPLAAFSILSACSKEEGTNDTLYLGGSKAVVTGYSCLDSMPYESLSAAEIAGLEQLREEELLARDVYDFLYGLYGMNIFNNISSSEQQHADMVAALLFRYNLPDPAVNHSPGIFSDSTIQGLYNSLTAAGSASLLDALIVGATIEDLDIYDLDHLVSTVVDNQDITWVFSNLERGSRNHMRAFYRQITRKGGSYTPQFISSAYFNHIISSPQEKGSGCP